MHIPSALARPREGRPSGRRPRRGAVLVSVLICLMVIVLVAGTLVRTGLNRRARVRAEERTWQAEWLAESGLERASARLAADPGYRGETWEPSAEELGGPWGGRVVIEVEARPGDQDGRAAFRVRARADYPRDQTFRARRTRQIQVERDSEPTAGRGVEDD